MQMISFSVLRKSPSLCIIGRKYLTSAIALQNLQNDYSKTYDNARNNVLQLLVLRGFRLNNFLYDQCWKCGAESKNILFCNKCKSIQRPSKTRTYFEVIDIPQNFNVNTMDLRNKYRQLQRLLHPDHFSNHTDDEREISADYSALVNKAFSTLLDPMSRGLYMLQLQGGSIEESKMQTNAELLMEIMERNEELAEIEDAEQLREFDERNRASLEELQMALSEAFSNNNISGAEVILAKMKYYRSLDSKIKELKQKLGVVQ